MTAALQTQVELRSDALLHQLDRASSLIESSVGAATPLYSRMQSLRERLQNRRLQIAVLGQFKRGKSTFVNALLGAPILPTAVVPLTAIPTFISWRDEPLVQVKFSNGQSSERFAASEVAAIREILSRFVTEEANPKNHLHVERVDLFYPAAILGDGTVLIDTPGIGSTLTHNTETALRVLPECDASLFIISADPPITESELAYLRRLKPQIGRTFFVLNKIDYLTQDEQVVAENFLRQVLTDESLSDRDTPIFLVSARSALAAKQESNYEAFRQSGMAAVEDYLERYLANHKIESLIEAIRRKAADIVSQTRTELELRARALSMPLAQLEQKSSEFSQTLRSIEAQRLVVSDLLGGDRRRLLSELEKRIDGLRGVMSFKLARVIDDSSSREGDALDEHVKLAVSAALEELFSNSAQEFVQIFSDEARDILLDHKRRVDGLVDEIRRTAAEMFDVAFAPEREPDSFRLTEEPYWVTEPESTTLIPDYGRLFDRLLPSSLRRRRRRARLIGQTNEMILRNAENLRWAILRGVDETFRAALGHFEARLGDAIGATKGVIEDALARRRDQSFGLSETLDRLGQSTDALSRAERAFIG
jgi:GTPase SAR1 family protein